MTKSEISYLPSPGNKITKEQLSVIMAKDVAAAIESLPYIKIIEFKKTNNPFDGDCIVIEVEVERGQVTSCDIKSQERIAIIFPNDGNSFPEVLALRSDFPQVPHLNLRLEEKPCSLCLYDEKYEDIILSWTPIIFIERIRKWLTLTAKGELHANDQSLEPLLFESPYNLIIPFDLFNCTGGSYENLIVRKIPYKDRSFTFVAERLKDIQKFPNETENVAITIQGSPQTHGIINRLPTNIKDLHEFLLKAEINLLNELRTRLPEIKNSSNTVAILKSHLILIINLPKKRTDTGPIETTDLWAFIIDGSLEEVGIGIGI